MENNQADQVKGIKNELQGGQCYSFHRLIWDGVIENLAFEQRIE